MFKNYYKLFYNFRTCSTNTEKFILNTFFVILLFLFVNPIFSILLITYFSIENKFSKSLTLIFLVTSISLFFFNRKFDVNFYIDSTDDVPNYVSYYLNLSTLSIGDIFDNFIKAPSGNEPLWHILWWLVNRLTNGNVYTFIFFHYFLIFYLFARISIILIPRYFEFLFLTIIFLFPVTLYNISHIWRQILSFEFFLLGSLLFYYKNKKYFGFILIIASFFIHVSSIFYIILFISFNALSIIKKNLTKNNILFYVISFLFILSLSLKVIFSIIGETFIHLASYTEGETANRGNLGIKLIFYILLTFYIYYKSVSNRMNLFLFICIIIPLCLPFIIPTLNAIYDRYFSLALTMLSIYVFINTFKQRENILYVTNKFLFGSYLFLLIISFTKLFFEYKSGIGVISFIGNANAFNFFNGIFYYFLTNLL